MNRAKTDKKPSLRGYNSIISHITLKSKLNRHAAEGGRGFTIVELLIVIVVIAILAAITVVAYNGIQQQAQEAKIKSDQAQLIKAIMIARENTGRTLGVIDGRHYSAGPCLSRPAGTNLATLPRSDDCWTVYSASLSAISDASGVNVRGIVDPWGRPYAIDENEGENGGCNRDLLAVYSHPYTGTLMAESAGARVYIPLSGNSGC